LRNRPGIRPGTKEELEKPVVKKIEKPREGLVPHQHPRMGFLGRRQRQCTLRPQQAEKLDQNPKLTVLLLLRPRQIRSREIHVRLLAEHHVFVANRGAVANPRLFREAAFEPAHHRKEIEAPWFVLEIAE
jgi:hypothetical protein